MPGRGGAATQHKATVQRGNPTQEHGNNDNQLQQSRHVDTSCPVPTNMPSAC